MCHFTPHSEGGCVNQFEMHLITSWPFVSVQARPIALFDLQSTRLVYSDPYMSSVGMSIHGSSESSIVTLTTTDRQPCILYSTTVRISLTVRDTLTIPGQPRIVHVQCRHVNSWFV